MREACFIVIVAAGVLLAADSARAHQSFAAQFDVNKPIVLSGILTRMEWVNPHGRMYVDVTSTDGGVQRWTVQTGGTTQLLRRGFVKADFPAGIEVTIKGFRARDGSRTLHGESVTLKDGRDFFIGEIPIT
jgi:hypothetical protein